MFGSDNWSPVGLFAVPKEGRAFALRLPTHSLTGPGLRPLSFFFESLRKPLSLAFGRRKGRRTRGFDARKGKERPLCFVGVADARPKASIGRRQKPMEGAIRHKEYCAEALSRFLPPAGGVP